MPLTGQFMVSMMSFLGCQTACADILIQLIPAMQQVYADVAGITTVECSCVVTTVLSLRRIFKVRKNRMNHGLAKVRHLFGPPAY